MVFLVPNLTLRGHGFESLALLKSCLEFIPFRGHCLDETVLAVPAKFPDGSKSCVALDDSLSSWLGSD